ncbi:hypothetical protein ACFO26_08210 [Lactococcus nasutitermitis]|uniref:Uncharacterized protein n=1 Tax=Lactococcus nasutitermitis TaxID=1652957 RepID=A0ABV9JEG2_9LACT|nr:hypothetical protein [Lactococcus nasutitermitis]
MTSIHEKDLNYCREMLEILTKLEDNERQRQLALEKYDKRLKWGKIRHAVELAVIFAFIVFAILESLHVFIYLDFFVSLIILVLSVALYFWLLTHGKMPKKVERVKLTGQRSLNKNLTELSKEKAELEMALKNSKIPARNLNIRDLQLMINYFERNMVTSLANAIFFLDLTEKNAQEDGFKF